MWWKTGHGISVFSEMRAVGMCSFHNWERTKGKRSEWSQVSVDSCVPSSMKLEMTLPRGGCGKPCRKSEWKYFTDVARSGEALEPGTQTWETSGSACVSVEVTGRRVAGLCSVTSGTRRTLAQYCQCASLSELWVLGAAVLGVIQGPDSFPPRCPSQAH